MQKEALCPVQGHFYPDIALCPPGAQRWAVPPWHNPDAQIPHFPSEQQVPVGFQALSSGRGWNKARCHEGHPTATSLKYIKCHVVVDGGSEGKALHFIPAASSDVSVISWSLGAFPTPQCLGPLVTLKCVCAWGCVCVYVCNEPLLDLWLSLKTSKVPGGLFLTASK